MTMMAVVVGVGYAITHELNVISVHDRLDEEVKENEEHETHEILGIIRTLRSLLYTNGNP